jgi:hypothetical protein
MIGEEKRAQALRALNKMLIIARHMAREKADHARIEALLDAAEVLPMLFLQERDATDLYREILAGTALEFPMLEGLLNVFDNAEAP